MRFCRDFTNDLKAYEARATLLRDVLALEPAPTLGRCLWQPFAIFTSEGQCIATLDVALLPLVVDRVTTKAGAIRAVATHRDHRGRGLFRSLMERALAWFDAERASLVLLFSAEPAIYSRFGFFEIPQHSFVGDAPRRTKVEPTRRLRLDDMAHRKLISNIVESREPVSSRCALQIDPDQYISNLLGDPSLTVFHLPRAQALLVFEEDDQDVTIVDYASLAKPDVMRMVGALPRQPRKLRTMFAPDRLGWHGRPEVESTGLMIRGALPPALSLPFMLPPTVEF